MNFIQQQETQHETNREAYHNHQVREEIWKSMPDSVRAKKGGVIFDRFSQIPANNWTDDCTTGSRLCQSKILWMNRE